MLKISGPLPVPYRIPWCGCVGGLAPGFRLQCEPDAKRAMDIPTVEHVRLVVDLTIIMPGEV